MKQTGTVNGVWSRITYQNDDGTEAEGYIPTSCLDLPDAVAEEADTIDMIKMREHSMKAVERAYLQMHWRMWTQVFQ